MAIPVVAGGGGAAALSMVLVRSLIRSLWDDFLPDWIRHGDDGSDDDGASAGVDGSGEEKDGRGDEDEMANLSAVLRKLDGLVKTLGVKSGHVDEGASRDASSAIGDEGRGD